MPKHTEQTVMRETNDGICGPSEVLAFGETGGLTQFGALVEILPPGSRSSLKHWHSSEDEMVYMLSGVVTLHEGATSVSLAAGEAATFKAGAPAGHCLENTGETEARYLVIGTRAPHDVITYPEHDRILTVDHSTDTRSFTTLDGRAADNPYVGG